MKRAVLEMMERGATEVEKSRYLIGYHNLVLLNNPIGLLSKTG